MVTRSDLKSDVCGFDSHLSYHSMFEAIAKPQREQKEASLIDPIKINDLIKSLEEEISLVETELDFTLSESNAKTEIEI